MVLQKNSWWQETWTSRTSWCGQDVQLTDSQIRVIAGQAPQHRIAVLQLRRAEEAALLNCESKGCSPALGTQPGLVQQAKEEAEEPPRS